MDLQYSDIHNAGIINGASINTNTGNILALTATDTFTTTLNVTNTVSLPMDTTFLDNITFETISIRDLYNNHTDMIMTTQKMRQELNELKEEIKLLKRWEEV